MSVERHEEVRRQRAAGPVGCSASRSSCSTEQQRRLALEAKHVALRQRYVALKIDYWHATAAGDDARAELLSGEARKLADDLKTPVGRRPPAPPRRPPRAAPPRVRRYRARPKTITSEGSAHEVHPKWRPDRSGPADWFTGTVYIDGIRNPDDQSAVGCAHVRFTPGARTAWHTHPKGQTLYVTDGIGYVARRGGAVQEIRPGDVVYIEPNEEHWHGATADRFMAHVAIQEADDQGQVVTWLDHVTDQEYGA